MPSRHLGTLSRVLCLSLLGWVASCNEACRQQHRPPSTPPSTAPATAANPPSDAGARPRADGPSCSVIARDYDAVLQRARACNPMAATAAQCRERVDSQLPCPCPTYANGNDRAALARLAQLAARWRARDCAAEVMCAQVMCQPAKSGNCQSVEGSRGRCLDR